MLPRETLEAEGLRGEEFSEQVWESDEFLGPTNP